MLVPLEKPKRDIDFASGGEEGIRKAEEAIDKASYDLLKAMKNLLVRFKGRATELKREGKNLQINWMNSHAKKWEDCLRKYSESMWECKRLHNDWLELMKDFEKFNEARDKMG